MNAPLQLDWAEANQRCLAAEFARLKARLGGTGDYDTRELEAARAGLPQAASLDVLTQVFGLSAFERDLLLLCAGVEMDAALAALCATAQGNPQRACATFSLALAALAEPHWSALTPVRPLRRWRLLEVHDEATLATGRLRIDERVLHFLAGVNYLDPRLQPLLRPYPPVAALPASQRRLVDSALAELVAREAKPQPAIHLTGNDAQGQQDVAAGIAAGLGLQLHVLRAEDLPAGVHEREALAVLWEREAALLGSALLLRYTDHDASPAVLRLAERLSGLLFLGGREPLRLTRPTLRLAVDKPAAAEQKELWTQALGPTAQRLNGALDGVACQFRLSAQTILTTGAELAPALASSDAPDAALWRACRSLGRPRLDDLAQRVEPAARWDDLVLPETQQSTLRQVAAHVKNRLKVYDDWGFAGQGSRGLGISALFAGESGTGKTMAAEVLADELSLDLYRIDLSAVVSKYIGETEKNLRRVFDAAEDSGALLLFDEADALFGKRSEVKDSHDRYANIEVSYLLQRMEAYRGLAILTTNLKTALDPAFQRRLRFVVHFPFPDTEQRQLIWRRIFPAATPTGELDYRKLAQLHVAGGNIRNIALNAAFLAAAAREPVTMTHLLHAAYSEAAKRERPLSDAETRGWV